MNRLFPALPFAVMIIGVLILRFVERPNKGGGFGRAIRNSNWHAWKMAMDDKERELQELRSVEPKR